MQNLPTLAGTVKRNCLSLTLALAVIIMALPTPAGASLIFGNPDVLQTDPTSAKIIAKPAGARQWIHLSGNDCVNLQPLRANAASCVASADGLLPLADYAAPDLKAYDVHLLASASSNGNVLRSYLDSNGAGNHLGNSMIDTYTLFSDTLAVGSMVDIVVSLTADATITRGATSGCLVGTYCGTGVVNIKVNGAQDDALISWENFPNTPVTQVHLSTSQLLSVAIGTTFDVNYQLNLSAVSGMEGVTLDASHTATIGIELPGGTTISSVLGYGVTAAVPEPTTLALLGFGLAGIGFCRRKTS